MSLIGVLRADLTPAHHDLLSRGRQLFTEDRLAGWLADGDAARPLPARAWREIAAAGLLGVSLPTELGGQGLGLLGSVLLSEAMSSLLDVGLPLGMHVHNDVAGAWLADATTELREQYLPALLAGTTIACQCDTDPAPGEPTTAVADGTDLVVCGRKRFVINGAAAGVCFVRVSLAGAPAIVLVPKELPGVRLVRVHEKLGTRTVDSAELEFADVRVPASHLVSRAGLGQLMRWNRVMSRMRLLIAVDAYFIHCRLLANIIRHARHRVLGGRALAAWPVNANALARAVADQTLMAAGIVEVLAGLRAGRPLVPEVAELKWFCVERASDLATLCCDLEGGAGYLLDSPSLADHAQLRGLRMAGGSQVTMLTIANHSLASRAELPGTDEGNPHG